MDTIRGPRESRVQTAHFTDDKTEAGRVVRPSSHSDWHPDGQAPGPWSQVRVTEASGRKPFYSLAAHVGRAMSHTPESQTQLLERCATLLTSQRRGEDSAWFPRQHTDGWIHPPTATSEAAGEGSGKGGDASVPFTNTDLSETSFPSAPPVLRGGRHL